MKKMMKVKKKRKTQIEKPSTDRVPLVNCHLQNLKVKMKRSLPSQRCVVVIGCLCVYMFMCKCLCV